MLVTDASGAFVPNLNEKGELVVELPPVGKEGVKPPPTEAAAVAAGFSKENDPTLGASGTAAGAVLDGGAAGVSVLAEGNGTAFCPVEVILEPSDRHPAFLAVSSNLSSYCCARLERCCERSTKGSFSMVRVKKDKIEELRPRNAR